MKNKIYIKGYDCLTSCGDGVDAFYHNLLINKRTTIKTDTSLWASQFKNYWESYKETGPLVNKIIDISLSSMTVEQFFTDSFVKFFQRKQINSLLKKRVGVIFSSTKGLLEDFIWHPHFNLELGHEGKKLSKATNLFLSKLLKKLQIAAEINLTINNACASSHVSIKVGSEWIQNNYCDDVIIFSADYIGPFIQTGFKSLKALSEKSCRPFDNERDGLVLGDGIGIIILSKDESEIELKGVEIQNESSSVTAPSFEGLALKKCMQALQSQYPSHIDSNIDSNIDFIMAHGTATILNDEVEDRVYSSLYSIFDPPIVTGTKWCIGHTLGCSGVLDIIAGCEAALQGTLFKMGEEIQTSKMNYPNYAVFENKKLSRSSTFIVNSIGFGGTAASILCKIK